MVDEVPILIDERGMKADALVNADANSAFKAIINVERTFMSGVDCTVPMEKSVFGPY